MSRAAAAPPTLAPPRRLAPHVRARLRVPRRALTPGCKAYHPDRHFTFDENHDTQFLSWLADLTVAVENSTWTAVPALLRFPRAKPHVVLQLAAGDGQLRLVETILRSCDDLDVRGVGRRWRRRRRSVSRASENTRRHPRRRAQSRRGGRTRHRATHRRRARRGRRAARGIPRVRVVAA